MPKAPAATRATDHATISFGLVSVPVVVYSGTVSDHGLTRKQFVEVPVFEEGTPADTPPVQVLNEDGTPKTETHPVGSQPYDKETGKALAFAEVQRKIETEYGFVYVADHEIEGLFTLKPKTIEVKAFQPLHLFHQGHYVPKALYFVEADKIQQGKKKLENKAAQQSLALVFEAMRKEGAMAVVEYTSRGIPKPAILLPDGTLWTVYHTDELREQRELPDVELPDAVVEQGRALISMLWSTDPLDLTDHRSALIQGFADDKAKAGDFGQSAEVVDETARPVETQDLAALLAASVEAAKAQRVG